ncbi:TVP38/TMEM64 family protein [Alteribacter populi]|uniref:TVP38/TMEM64 family protein n=1 Tax=Alteribacter populi TaxID=2011011 RepID=UPI0012FD7F2C|nr:VTT domain-containing protein [Alteribacter populi]
MKKWLSGAALLIILIVVWQSDWVTEARSNNVDYFIDTLFEEMGYFLLFVTIPLMILQNIFTLFPVLLIIVVHLLSFGVIEGAVYSLIGTLLGALACFYLVKHFNHRISERIWSKRKEKFDRYYRWISEYGVCMIIVLRSIPVFPSNLISAAAAFTPINWKAYFWSSLFGNLSMVWLLSLLSSPLWIEDVASDSFLIWAIAGFVLYCVIILTYYFRKMVLTKKYTSVPERKLS